MLQQKQLNRLLTWYHWPNL